MNVPTRLGVFALGLLVVFAAAVGVGRATGPFGPVGSKTESHEAGHEHGAEPAGATDLPGGLATSRDGYTLVLDATSYEPGERELAFRVEDAEGEPVTDYDVEHDKTMHLVAVRRDFAGFQHVHPTLDGTGTWRVPLDLTAGSWRVFADFVPSGGSNLVLGADLDVAGRPQVAEQAVDSRTDVVDDYTVSLAGDLAAGEHSMLALTVSRDGVPVTDLDPYLGAYGHLVALREGDLAYHPVHPEDGPAGPTIEFGTEVPSAGRYHLFLDFQHVGVVRTAAFAVEVEHEHH